MREYGYVRVSSQDQSIDRQMLIMKERGIKEDRIFIDKQSGKDFNRPAYKRMLKKLKEDDVLYIKSIDRLGRNYDEILEQWNILTKRKKVYICVIDFPLLDTRRNNEGITGQFIADLVLQILSYVAQIERENIRQRQAEGIYAAKLKGIKFGRPLKEIPDNFLYYYNLWKDGKISKRRDAKELNMTYSMFTILIKMYQQHNMSKNAKN